MGRLRRVFLAAPAIVLVGALAAPNPASADVVALQIDDTAKSDYYTVRLTGVVRCSDDQAGYHLRIRALLLDLEGDLVESSPITKRCTGSLQSFQIRVSDPPDFFDGFGSVDVTVIAETAAPGAREVSDTMTVTEYVVVRCPLHC